MMNATAREKLRRLARLPDSRYPVLSIYLDTRNDSPQKHEELRIFLKNAIRDAESVLATREDRASFERDVERVSRFIEDEIHAGRSAPGHAIFACSPQDLFEVIPARRPFTNQFLVSNRPLIRQLAVMLDEYEPVAAVVIDMRAARIFEISLVDGVTETAIDGGIARQPSTHEWQGFGDLKYQRAAKGQIEAYWKEVGDFLARLVDRGIRRIVVFGQDQVVQGFRRALPRRVDERVVATGHMDRHEQTDRIVARVLEIVRAEEKRQERALVELVRDQALSGNLGVFGLEATLDALRKGQVHKLVIADDLRARGWRCRGCGALSTHLKRDACPHCGAGTDVVELGDEVVKDAIAQGAEVETVRPSDDLARMGKIGALLRFRD